MRAKMSLPNHGTSDCAMRPGCCGHPSDAFDEARAILAETEDGRRYATLAYLRLSRMPANVVACDALADALRSFLEA